MVRMNQPPQTAQGVWRPKTVVRSERCYARGWQGAVGWLRGGETRAAPCWTQPAPMDPPLGTAEPRNHDSSASRKACVRKGKTLPGSEG